MNLFLDASPLCFDFSSMWHTMWRCPHFLPSVVYCMTFIRSLKCLIDSRLMQYIHKLHANLAKGMLSLRIAFKDLQPAYAWSWVVRIHHLYRRSKSAAEHAENWFMQRGRGHMFTVWRAYCCQAEIFTSSVHNAQTWGWFWDAILYLYVLIVARALCRTSPRIWEYCVNECSICIGDLSFVISRLKEVKLMR